MNPPSEEEIRDAMYRVLVVSLAERVEGLTVVQAAECAAICMEVLNPKVSR